jgi:hypothetical protein
MLAPADGGDERTGGEEAGRVGEHGDRRAERLHQAAAGRRAGDEPGGARDFELRVAVDEPIPSHQARQVRLVRDVEEHGQHPRGEGDQEELDDRQRAQPVGRRDGGQRRRAPEVGRDHDRTAPDPVDPRARRKADEQERRELAGAEHADLEWRGVEDQDRDQRERDHRHVGAELAHHVGPPEAHEVPVAPEARRAHPRCTPPGCG